jgi:predicted dehydrogenase
VISDATKANELSEMYGVSATFTYEQFNEALASETFDAIYRASGS